MHKPELYIKNNHLAKGMADYVVTKHSSLLQAADNHAVIDVGCGPGNATFENVLPLLPKTTKKVVAVDISPAQINYARSHYEDDPRISFQELDVTTDTLPNDLMGAFDLVLSLNCIHCVNDQRKAVANLWAMAKPGGKILVSLMRKTIFPVLWQIMYDNPKWTQYLSNFKSYFPVRSTQYFKDLFDEVGFDKVEIEEENRVQEYTQEKAFDVFTAINMFKIPEDLMKDYVQDLFNCFLNAGHGNVDTKGQKWCNFPYTILIITAVKP